MSLGAGHALDASCLVLNKYYMAVHVVSVRRAFCLLFKELAEVITLDDGRYASFDFASWREVSEARVLFREPDDDFIRTVHFEIQVPRIIRLLTYDRLLVRRSSSIAGTSSPRRQPLPVLRQEVRDRRAQPRPRRAAQSGRQRQPGTTSSARACGATSAKGDALPAKPECG